MADDEKLREEFEAIHERFLELEKTVELLHLGLVSEEKRNKQEISELEKKLDEVLDAVCTHDHMEFDSIETMIGNPILGDNIPEDARLGPGLKQRIEKLELDRKAQTKQIEYWGKQVEELKVFRHHVAMPRIIGIEEVLQELLMHVDLKGWVKNKELIDKLNDGEKSVEQVCDVEKVTAQQTDSTPSKYECISCGRPMNKGELCPICRPKEPPEAGSARQTDRIPSTIKLWLDTFNYIPVETVDLEEVKKLTKKLEMLTYRKLLQIKIKLIIFFKKYLTEDKKDE